MKKNQKGLATGAIVAIVVTVVVVVVVVAVAAVLLIKPGGVGVGSLPLYAGATKSDNAPVGSASSFVKAGVGRENSGSISDVPSGCEDELYVAPAGTTSVSEILSWYKTNMASQGWTLVYEESYSYNYLGFSMSWGMLYFDKGDRSAAIVVGEYEGEIYFALVEGPDSLFDPWMDYAGYEWEEPTDGGGGGGGIAGATSLSYTVDATVEGAGTTTMTCKMKDIGSSSMKILIEGTAMGQDFTYIINGALREMWICSDGQWVDMSEMFESQWDQWTGTLEGYEAQLSGWTGGEDWTYTDPATGTSVRIYNIEVNPILDDSLFVH